MSTPLSEHDRVQLNHMHIAAQQALLFAQGRDRDQLDLDVMFRRAVLHCIQEIGEAASRVSEEARLLSPGIPWRQIVGMRHRVVHSYFSVDADLVWEVLQRELRPLVRELKKMLQVSE